ncbi:MAG TPA: 6-bladed beta-propeller [Chitinophagaceae bacterium]|nr:6-bladed beta-propeller [Chitinophagaceae bacterium]
MITSNTTLNSIFYVRIFAIFLYSFSNYSCSKTKGVIDENHPIVIHLNPNNNHLPIVNYVDSLSLVNLEMSKNSIISEAIGIQKIIYKNSKYFILDGRYMEIKVFDSTGKYLYNIGNLGLAKGQFLKIEDIEYFKDHNSIFVLCNDPTKISEFSLDGTILNEVNMDFWATAFTVTGPDSRIFYVNQNSSVQSEDKNILLTDSSYKIYTKMFKVPRNLKHMTIKFSGGLFNVNGETYFNPAFSNIYYKFHSDTATACYKIDYGTKNVPEDILPKILLNSLSNYNFQSYTFVKSNDYIGFNYMNNNQLSTAFYNMHSGNIATAETDLDSLNILFQGPIFQSENKFFITVLDSRNLNSFIRRNAAKIREKFPHLYSHLNLENPNPALLIFKLKPSI